MNCLLLSYPPSVSASVISNITSAILSAENDEYYVSQGLGWADDMRNISNYLIIIVII